jgi:hypothetical protein
MALVIPDAAEVDLAKYYVNKSSPENLVLRLYVNNYSPVSASTVGSFTEASGGGYSAIEINGADWSVTPGAPTYAVGPQQTFSCDGTGSAQLCYGYFTTRATSGVIAHAERFNNGPYSFTSSGDQIKITPRIEFGSALND